jgi:hypothetical protein
VSINDGFLASMVRLVSPKARKLYREERAERDRELEAAEAEIGARIRARQAAWAAERQNPLESANSDDDGPRRRAYGTGEDDSVRSMHQAAVSVGVTCFFGS